MKIKEVKATGEFVALKMIKVDKPLFEKSSSGLLLKTQSGDEKTKWSAIVYDIGPLVDSEKFGIKKGDKVFFNEYDAKYIGHDDNNMFCLVRAVSIMAVFEEE